MEPLSAAAWGEQPRQWAGHSLPNRLLLVLAFARSDYLVGKTGLGSGIEHTSSPSIHPTVRGRRSHRRGELQQCEWELTSVPSQEASGNSAWSAGEKASARLAFHHCNPTLPKPLQARPSPLPEISRTRVDRSRRAPGSDAVDEGSQSSPRPKEGLWRDWAPTPPSDLGSPQVAETTFCSPSSQDSSLSSQYWGWKARCYTC